MIEVDREFDGFDNLLGLHTWSEFLQKPSKEQLDKVSKVFYCTYNTGRLVEKNGSSASRSTPRTYSGRRRLEACQHRRTLVQWVDTRKFVSSAVLTSILTLIVLQHHQTPVPQDLTL